MCNYVELQEKVCKGTRICSPRHKSTQCDKVCLLKDSEVNYVLEICYKFCGGNQSVVYRHKDAVKFKWTVQWTVSCGSAVEISLYRYA